MKKHIKEFQNHHGDHTESHLFHYIPPETFKNKNVLEIGCGFGGGVINFRKNGALAYGIDIDKDAIERAKMIAKQSFIATKRVKSLYFYYPTCIFIGKKR